MIASIVDTGELWEVVWVSAVSGIGVTSAFGVAIFGATRATDLGRSGRTAEAALLGIVGLAALAAVAAAIVFGIIALADK
jgi:hypothetical protein